MSTLLVNVCCGVGGLLAVLVMMALLPDLYGTYHFDLNRKLEKPKPKEERETTAVPETQWMNLGYWKVSRFGSIFLDDA